MKKIDFSQSGGFPLEQDTFDFMQKAYHEGIEALMGHLGTENGDNYIVSGVDKNDDHYYSDGWMIIEGELMRFQSGVRTDKVEVVENTKLATFKTGQAHPVYLEKFPRFSQDDGIKIDEDLKIEGFIRIKGARELEKDIIVNAMDIKELSEKTLNEFTPIKNKLSTI